MAAVRLLTAEQATLLMLSRLVMVGEVHAS